MPRPHRPPNPAVDAPSLGHELKLFASALVIGLVLGIGGSALWHQRTAQPLNSQLTTATTAQQTCLKSLDSAQKKLNQCQRDLKLEQLKPSAPPSPSFAPSLAVTGDPVPKPKPDMTATPTTPAPIAVPTEPVPPTAPLSWPKGIPPAPKPKPGAALTVVPPTLPEMTPAPADTNQPTVRQRVPSPRPKVIPPRATNTIAPEAAPSVAFDGSTSLNINVGEEKTIGRDHHLRLIAVSKRKSGSYCVLAGNSMESTRVPSGRNQTVSWAGTRVVLSATVQDSDTCRVSIRPAS